MTQKRKLFYNAKPSAYYFYVKAIISVDFQICVSVLLIFSVAFGVYDGKLYGSFLWMGFNCLKATTTSGRQFTFYH